jgi:DNA polymerase-3 subunit epsilon
MSWHTGRLAAFDIETTGVNPESDRIVTAAVSIVGGDLPADHHSWLVNPGIDIPLGATRVHGITSEQAQAAGSDPEEAIDEITAVLTAQLLSGVPVVAFNARFDLTILDREARRHGLRPLLDRVGGPDGIFVVDPHVLDKHFDRYRSGKRTLGAVCRHYGVSLEHAHTANADALAAARLAYKMGATVPELRDVDLRVLHRQQVSWAAEQAASLQQYYRRRASNERVEGAWPIIPAGLATATEPKRSLFAALRFRLRERRKAHGSARS